MPPSIGVAAFVIGVVLVLAAIIGREVKIAAIELPALDRTRRLLAGGFGVLLLLFGLFDGQVPFRLAGSSPETTPPTASAPDGNASSAPVATNSSTLPCLADVPENDFLMVPVEKARRTDRRFSSGQPRDAVLGIQFTSGKDVIGGLKFATSTIGSGVDIVSVVDAACQPLATYANVSRPGQAKDAPYQYDTIAYRFGDVVVEMDLAYAETGDTINLRAQQVAR